MLGKHLDGYSFVEGNNLGRAFFGLFSTSRFFILKKKKRADATRFGDDMEVSLFFGQKHKTASFLNN